MKHFTNWTFAFLELQMAFKIDVVEISDSLFEMIVRDEEILSSINSSSSSSIDKGSS